MNRVAALLLASVLMLEGQVSSLDRMSVVGPVTDEYYPAEEAAECRAIVWPRLVELRQGGVLLQGPDTHPHEVRLGERYYEWELVALLAEPEPLAVLERNFAQWGLLGYVGRNGPIVVLRKAIGRLDQLRQPNKPFPAEYFDRLLAAREDVLGQQALAAGNEPAYPALAGYLPPLQAYTFLGTVSSRRKVVVLPDGLLGWLKTGRPGGLEEVLFDPRKVLSISAMDTPSMATKQGLIGGYLPAIDFGFFDPDRRSGWEQIAFAVGEAEVQIRLCLRSSAGNRTYWQIIPLEQTKDGTAFYRDLLILNGQWEKFFVKGMQVEVPEPRVSDAARAGIVRALISGIGLHPKYGIGDYWGSQHDAFPPATLLLNTCLLDWGFLEEARDRLAYYLSHFVKKDGTFDYYGPALSEYGQMLALAARYVRVAGDIGWLRTNLPPLERIGNRLLADRTAGRGRSSSDSPHYGLLWGAAEADTANEPNFYFSGDVWCWRGLVELGFLLTDEGQRSGDAAWTQLGRRWFVEAETYREDILAALRRFHRTETAPAFLPPIAGTVQPFDRMTQDGFSSYTNYRYWPEMLSAGLLTPEMRDAIIAYRSTRGGELLAMTRFADLLDDWPYAHYAWGLLSSDRADHYLLGFYGHLAHHQTPGTFTAYESVPIRGHAWRDFSSDYCVPAQLVLPQMLRWMIVWEGWDGHDLWLAPAVPRRWFRDGFTVKRVPTRWGSVSLTVTLAGDTLKAQVELASSHPKVKVHLHLRPPGLGTAQQVTVEGTKNWKWETERQVLHFSGDWKRLSITVR